MNQSDTEKKARQNGNNPCFSTDGIFDPSAFGHGSDGWIEYPNLGMTKREYFAKEAITAVLSDRSIELYSNEDIEKMTDICVVVADSLLKSLEKMNELEDSSIK